jgi:hypothetical protein
LYGQENTNKYTLTGNELKQSNKSYSIKELSTGKPEMTPDATTIIDPSGAGGFENGTTFSANGWTTAQSSNNSWYVSTLNPPGPTQGTRCAITGSSATNWTGQARTNVNHIYRNFTVPSGESKIKLTFNFINKNADSDGDYLYVYVVPTTTSVTAGTLLSTGQVLALTDAQTTYAEITVYLDPSYAGTTQRLVFTWSTNSTTPLACIGIDEISLTSSAITTITSTATGGNWGESSTWIGNVVPNGDNVIINGPVYVEDDYFTNDLTVNSTLTTADIGSPYILQLSVLGTFIVNAGATVNIGGFDGGRLQITGTGKSHSISGTVNIYWALNFNYPRGTSNSTVTVNSGSVITNDAAADGQLALRHGVQITFAVGSSFYNYNNITSQGLCGLNILETSRVIINGILTNGTAGSIYSSNINALTVNGTFNYASGYWVSGSNPVIYGSTATLAYTGGTLTTSNNEWQSTYRPYNVIINSTGNITLHAARTISGTLYLMQGNFVNSTLLTMANGTTINRSNGSISAIPTFNTNCNVIYSNTANITTGPELPAATGTILNNLTFQGSGVVTFNKNATVKGTATLTMTSGIVNVANYTLMLGTSSTARGTLVTGNARVTTSSTSTTSGLKLWFAGTTVDNIYFPVGTSLYYNLITLSFTSAPSAGSLTAKFIPGDPGSPSIDPLYDVGISPEPDPYIIDCYSQRGYWQLDAGNGLSGGTYDISLRGEGFNPSGSEITNYTELRVLKRTNGNTNPWTLPPVHIPATGSNSIPIIYRSGLTSFSQFGMGGNWGRGNLLQGPLPVKLSSFNSVINGRNVILNWVTEMEENNEGFEVQKTEYNTIKNEELKIKNNDNWMKVGFVKGSGTKNSSTNYSFEDKNLQTGKYKYRLKQIDYNGNFEYFELAGVIDVGVPAKFDLSQNYPNPFNPVTKINFDIPNSGIVILKIYDILGKEVAAVLNEMKDAGYYTVLFDASGLSSGIYFYRFSTNGFSSVKRMIVLK